VAILTPYPLARWASFLRRFWLRVGGLVKVVVKEISEHLSRLGRLEFDSLDRLAFHAIQEVTEVLMTLFSPIEPLFRDHLAPGLLGLPGMRFFEQAHRDIGD
jgi:hypothetical protein